MDVFFQPHLLAQDGCFSTQLDLEDNHIPMWGGIKNILLTLEQNQTTTPEQAQSLVKLMMTLHKELDTTPEFIYALHLAQTSPRNDGAWIKQRLAHDNDLFLELITYFADYPTPIHDFPGQAIINLPLTGRMCIDYYVNGHAALEAAYPIAKLRRTTSHTFGYFEAAMCLPWDSNIQEIRATTERCVTLSAGLNRDCHENKSWYLPISPRNTHAFFAQRLRRNE